MSRRRLLVFGFLVVLVMLGVGGVVLWAQPRTAITRENAAKIQVGMALTEVEAILGGPARDESSGPLFVDRSVAGADSVRLVSITRSMMMNFNILAWVS